MENKIENKVHDMAKAISVALSKGNDVEIRKVGTDLKVFAINKKKI